MKNEFVPYELSKRLYLLGYNERNIYHYCNGLLQEGITYNSDDIHRPYENVSAPLYQQAFRWFRENYGLFGIILPYLITGNRWYYKITNRNNSSDLPFETGFDSYEEAEIACLTKLIEIVENK